MDQEILGPNRWKVALVYIDDVILYTRTLDEHVKALRDILQAAIAVGLKFSSKKSFIGYPSLRLLGKMISDEGLSVITDRTRAIKEMPKPKTVQELYALIGLFGYYRQHIINFARYMAPLTKLTKGLVYRQDPSSGEWAMYREGSTEKLDARKTLVGWGAEQDWGLGGLQTRITEPPTLAYFDPTKPIILYVDSCYKGMSVIMHQAFEEKAEAFTLTPIATSALEDLLKEQLPSDPVFGAIYSKLNDGQEHRPYSLEDGLLIARLDGIPRICLSTQLLPQVAQDFHDSMGHPASDKFYASMASRYYHPSLYKTVVKISSSCSSCQLSKPSRKPPAGEIEDIRDIPPSAFAVVAVDIVTGFPATSSSKFNAVLVIYCLWTRLGLFIPCKETLSAQKLADLWFDNVTARGLAPIRIISDRGPQFIADFWRKWQAKLGTSLAFSAAYHQQANPAERAVQTIEILLRIYCNDHPEHWYRHLKHVELAHNSVVHSSTGESPFDMLYSSYSKLWPERIADDSSEEARVKVKTRLLAARDTHVMARERQARYYNDRHSTPPSYQVGDLVAVRVDARPLSQADRNLHKLRQLKRGPFTITRVHSKVAVEIDIPDRERWPTPVFTTDQLEPWRGSAPAGNGATNDGGHGQPAPPPPTATEGDAATPSPDDAQTGETRDVTTEDNAPRRSRRNEGRQRRRWTPGNYAANMKPSEWLYHEKLAAAARGNKLVERPILYLSRQARDAEQRYNITELELAGLVWAVLRLRYYLEGAQIIVVTDHQALVNILKTNTRQTFNQRVQNHRMLLSPYEIDIVYRPGRKHANADALSRLPTSFFPLDKSVPSPGEIFEGGPPDKNADPLNLEKDS